jgi:hypothetical protein
MRKLIGCSTFVLALFSTAPEMAAQEVGPQKGQRSISFGVRGDGGNSFGLWTMLSDRTNLGLIGIFEHSRGTWDPGSRQSTRTSLDFAPTLRRYTGQIGPVLPYLQGGIGVGYHTNSVEDYSGRSVGARGGIGVEWFPVSNVGVGGYTGLNMGYMWSRSGPSDFRRTADTFSLTTMTSGLSVQIYFGGKGASAPVAAAQ